MKRYQRVLTIAGSDSGGGAGIQADLKTFAALECFGTTVITAITAQNTQGIHAIFPLPASIVTEQLDAIFADIGSDAIKIGMLFDSDIIKVVTQKLSTLSPIPIVLDPLMRAKGGFFLLKPEAVDSLKKLFPLSLLITPNLIEASMLLGYQLDKKEQMEKAALDLLDMGANNILLKGGHLLEEQGSDCFCSKTGEISWMKQPVVQTKNTHGTGCTLAAAIAAFLAKKYPLKEAIQEGKRFFHSALLAGAKYELGSGYGPLHPFYAFWRQPCAR
jgi:hydroxymethylpyrimidine/phosphomethylpyrimidine kinase